MSTEDRQQQTTVNVQEKANLIWAIADKLVGVYKPHEYGNVILPMCVVKRFEDTLAPTKQKVLDMNRQLDADGITVKQGFLEKAAVEAENKKGKVQLIDASQCYEKRRRKEEETI